MRSWSSLWHGLSGKQNHMRVFSANGVIVSLRRKVDAQVHRALALAVLISGLWFISPLVISVINGDHLAWFDQNSWREVINAIGLTQLPRVVVSMSLVLMSLGLLSRARLAWAFTLALLVPVIAISGYAGAGRLPADVIYNGILFLALLHYWGAFSRSSVTAGTLFAFSSLVCLFWYAILGVLYLGHEFAPKIETLPNAVYFSFVTMSTVGFGDIVPISEASRLFVVSIILLGVTVFASALGAVIAPFISGKIREIIQRKARLSMKRDHVILCGATPLALNLYQSLIGRGEQVTVVVRPGVVHEYPASADIILGDASSDAVLEQAGVKRASYVLALLDDDPDNAFIVLAVKAIDECEAKTVAVVNNTQNLEKIRRVKPDLLFSPQLFGAEVLSRMMRGEKFDTDLINDLFIEKSLVVEGDQKPDA